MLRRESIVEMIATNLIKEMELAPLEDKVPHLSVIKPHRAFSSLVREDPFEPYPYGDGSIGGMFLNAKKPSAFEGEFQFVIRRAPVREGRSVIRGKEVASLWRYAIRVDGEISDGGVMGRLSLTVHKLSWKEDSLGYSEEKVGEWENSFNADVKGAFISIAEFFPDASQYFEFPDLSEARYLVPDLPGKGPKWLGPKDLGSLVEGILEKPVMRLNLLISLRGNLFTLALLNDGVWAKLRLKVGGKRKAKAIEKDVRLSSFTPIDKPSETWASGVLLEATGRVVYGNVEKSGGPLWPKDVAIGIGGLYKARVVAKNTNETYRIEIYKLSDAQIEKEGTYEVESMRESLDESIRRLSEEFLRKCNCSNPDAFQSYTSALVEALKQVIPKTKGVHRLRRFQYDAAEKFIKLYSSAGLRSSDNIPHSLALLATTASGKTLAFLVPILLSLGLRLANELKGTTAVLVYPTRALAVDQAKLIIKILWYLNTELTSRGFRPLRLGILAGETPSLGGNEVETRVGYRFRHPVNGRPFRVKISRGDANHSFRYEYFYDDSEEELSADDKEHLSKLLSVVRDEIYAEPPDILITTPDTLNLRLMDLPESHSIFGRRVKICPKCRAVYTNLRKRVCNVCKNDLSKEREVSYLPPEIFVLDEVHQLRGSFGAQVSYVFSRLETVVREYLNGKPYSPLYVFSSATFRKPEIGVQRFLRVSSKGLIPGDNFYQVRPKSKVTRDISRIHVFVKPKVYSEVATLARLLERLGRLWEKAFDHKPKTIVFVNSISEVNLLLNTLKDRLVDYRIKGHSTDFEVERSRIEEEFSRCRIDLLIATSGLEVGVDFDEVEVVVIFGAPSYLADYRQRIGRAGRSPEKRPALIIHVFKSKPVDYLYKRQFEIVYEEDKLERYLAREEVPLAVENTVVRRRSVERAVLDYLATRIDSHKIYDEPLSKGRIGQSLRKVKVTSPDSLGVQEEHYNDIDQFIYENHRIKGELIDYLGRAVRLYQESIEKEELELFTRITLELLRMLSSYEEGFILSEVSHRDKLLRKLSSLRSSDETVEVNLKAAPFRGRYRTRALGIFLGKYYEKGIYSYMGVNLIIDNVRSRVLRELASPEPVMKEQIPKPELLAADDKLVELFSSRYLLIPGEKIEVEEPEEVSA